MCPAVDEVEQHDADPDEDQPLKAADAGADGSQRDAHAQRHDREDELSPVRPYVRQGYRQGCRCGGCVRSDHLTGLNGRRIRRRLGPELVVGRLAVLGSTHGMQPSQGR